ncbi:MAG: ammonium transporter [SAR202 cluster bacterium]|nr:ammonium transporter [SAR202 cluster bacterium]
MRRLVHLLPLLIALTAGLASYGLALAEGDPTGAKELEADPNAPVNFAWTLVTGFLVFFMQAGFAALGAGLVRVKNTVNYLTKSFMDFCMASLSFWAFGFAFMFGGSGAVMGATTVAGLATGNPVIGTSGFFLVGDAYSASTNALWLFQMVFAATAATIVAGAVAERMKITAYLAYSFIIGAVIYPIYGHWLWGGGWLWTLGMGSGARDFAGSGVVHAVGGLVALAGAIMVGPRIGKFTDGKPNKIPGHSIVLVVMGTFILFFGWFGFNPGSTLAATDLRISVIAVNTFLAGTTGAVVAIYYSLMRRGKADLVLACNGSLAGLVGITAPCAYVTPWAAVVIGAIAPLIMIATAWLVESKLKVDDVVGAVGVHAGGGLWGLLALGLFADGTYAGVKGLFYGGAGQLGAQVVSMIVVTAWALGTGLLMFWALKMTIGLRASREEEMQGLDIPEHGMPAYAEPAGPAAPTRQ